MKIETRFIIVSLVIYFALSLSAYAAGRKSVENAERERDEALHYSQIVTGECENAKELASQYMKQYAESVTEIAQLKAQNEALEREIITLSKPDDGTYDKEFGYDYDYVVRVVGAEARGEPFAGILAVAQCIADTAERTGQTPEQVVKSGQYTSPVARTVLDGMEEVNEACLLVFACNYRPFDEPIEYFYSTRNGGYSAWHES